MKYCWTTINVNDMDVSVDFYKTIIGLPLVRRFKSPTGLEIAFLGSGETQVELLFDPQITSVDFGSDISLGFEVDSLDVITKTLSEYSIPVYSGPFKPNPTIQFIYILDPNGVRIQFVEHIR